MMTKLEKKLNTIDACSESLEWAATQKGSFQDIWDNCQRGDWLLWLLITAKAKHQKMVMIYCKMIRNALVYIKNNEEIPLRAIEAIEKFIKGQTTIDDIEYHLCRASNKVMDDCVNQYVLCSVCSLCTFVIKGHMGYSSIASALEAAASSCAAIQLTKSKKNVTIYEIEEIKKNSRLDFFKETSMIIRSIFPNYPKLSVKKANAAVV